MIKAFADASVMYAAIISPTGGSRELLKRHMSGQVQLVVSDYVLEEVRRNLQNKAPNNAGSVAILLDLLAFDVVEVDKDDVSKAAEYTALKDAPVVAAALMSECEYLLTYDKQHLLGNEEVATKSGLTIATPGDLLQHLNEKD